MPEVMAGNARAPNVAEKLAERDERHKRMGDSRYVVEPNVKEGKGGLRDLHPVLDRQVHPPRPHRARARRCGAAQCARTAAVRAPGISLLAVRCHLHILAGRAEDRLTFDFQREIGADAICGPPGQKPRSNASCSSIFSTRRASAI